MLKYFIEINHTVMRNSLTVNLSGFGIYVGYNPGINFGFDIWLGKFSSYGLLYGNTNIEDARYGVSNLEEMALNLGF